MKNEKDLDREIKEILGLIDLGTKVIEKSERSILILGDSRSGKSTLANLLVKNPLVSVFDEKEDEFVIEIDPDQDSQKFPAIKHGTLSETTVPNKMKADTGVVVWDCPGFSETGGTKQEIANAFYVQSLFEKSASAKIAFAVPETYLKGNAHSFIGTLERFANIFKDHSILKESISLVVTKANFRSSKQEKKKFVLEKIALIAGNKLAKPGALEILEYLKNSIFLFYKPKESEQKISSDMLYQFSYIIE